MKIKTSPSDWEGVADTPQEFKNAFKEAGSEKEKEFFQKLLFKILHEPAGSNDVLLHHKDNSEGLYILRISDDFMIGKHSETLELIPSPAEYSGLFTFLNVDLYPYIGKHITIWEWLRERDFTGICYNANNDER